MPAASTPFTINMGLKFNFQATVSFVLTVDGAFKTVNDKAELNQFTAMLDMTPFPSPLLKRKSY